MLNDESPSPPLRWAGSKRKLLPELMPRIQQLCTARYIEPFFGSGCVFFKLQPQCAVIGDLNDNLINFYKQLKYQPRKLHREFSTLDQNDGSYYQYRAEYNEQPEKLRRAALFLYLNRLSFNAIYRTNMRGEFNVPMGTRVGALPTEDELRCASKSLKKTEIIRGDFFRSLRNVAEGDFVYLDPPYDYSGRIDRGEYGVGAFSCLDIERLGAALELIDQRGAHFILSYLDTVEIATIARRWNSECVSVRRQVASFSSNRKVVDELIISNRIFL
ncbi:Dam family site-specific DNA-(adenine-N6)-methyltransferase [Coraliomargarita sp. SDUM461004]|uniref:Site-specific DNA-methyltransferase (adenine-specific) n=1 Tax=Thalassobacterium sedimentorum TaxID=3041258 RepID=A0ABU1AGP0_9BACT|nr:Dam family site-specific DNA-(adenine-N6)-methyltransferase [Coraliomargarita sp. SDUM461004]MDQ8192788.1 Dam family site-specific DNA-(adenine-N6)-methyltransferase [Coraliomargarita sp. SDUM461004]